MTVKDKVFVIDTNSLIDNPSIIEGKKVILTSVVLRELEKLELRRSDHTLQYNIRTAKRILDQQLAEGGLVIEDIDSGGVIEGYNEDYVDNIIIRFVHDNGYALITNDILMKHKALSLDIEVISSREKSDDDHYTGFKEKSLARDQIAEFYGRLDLNRYGLVIGEYLVIHNVHTEEVHDVLVWTGKWHESIIGRTGNLYKTITGTDKFEKLTAKDIYQSMAIDSLERNQVTMVRGKPGSGKTLLSLSYAWKMINKSKKGRLVIFFNPAPSKNSIEMGFYKGTLEEKALSSQLGTMLKSKFGSEHIVKAYIEDGMIEIYPFTDLRGWDSTSDKETVVLISEAQNLTTDLLKMGLQRISDDTKVIIDGDFEQQVDRDVYAHDNGMKRASEVLRGTELFGEIELQAVYRSRLASIVDSM